MMGVAQDALPLKASQLRYRVRYSSNKCLVFEKRSLFQAFSHQFKRSAMVNGAFVAVERKQRKVWVFSASLLSSRCMLVHSTLLTERLEQPTGSFVFFKMFLFVSCLCAFYSLFFIFFLLLFVLFVDVVSVIVFPFLAVYNCLQNVLSLIVGLSVYSIFATG